jgi:hypothetical protein
VPGLAPIFESPSFFPLLGDNFDLPGSGFPVLIRNTVTIAVTYLSLNLVLTVRCHDPSLAKVLKTYKFESFLDRHKGT